ncbi:MAG: 30S ribosomal protein S14 [archaeon]|jgi:ribosomal protein S14
MSYPKAKNEKMKKRDRVCRMCGTRKGLIRKYKMVICRRCFKDNAEILGFKKYD